MPVPAPPRALKRHNLLNKFTLGTTALVLTLSTSGCGPSAAPSGEPAKPGPTSTKRSKPSENTNSETARLRQEIAKAANLPPVDLAASTRHLRAPQGFAQADVDSLTARAIDILNRSWQPRLSSMSPDDAIDYVYKSQYPATSYDFARFGTKAAAGYPWQWLAASRYLRRPSAARVIRVTSSVTRVPGRYDDGTPAPILRVFVQAHAVQNVRTEYGTALVVVRRTVRASSFRPRGGPDWWPAILTFTTPFGNGGCGLYKSAQLVPAEDTDTLRTDLADLKASLRSETVIPEPFGSSGNGDVIKKYLDSECK